MNPVTSKRGLECVAFAIELKTSIIGLIGYSVLGGNGCQPWGHCSCRNLCCSIASRVHFSEVTLHVRAPKMAFVYCERDWSSGKDHTQESLDILPLRVIIALKLSQRHPKDSHHDCSLHTFSAVFSSLNTRFFKLRSLPF